MSSEKPEYLGSWKGKIIKAIAIEGAKTWKEIYEKTKISPKSLNIALRELHSKEKISKNEEGEYKVEYELYKKYKKYYKGGKEEEIIEEEEEEEEEEITEEIKDALIVNIKGKLSEKDRDNYKGEDHHYLESAKLSTITDDLFFNASKEILIINPFVDGTTKGEILEDMISQKKLNIILITRKPDNKGFFDKKLKEKRTAFHKKMIKSGIKLFYKDDVHAKLIVVDKAIAIVSSMNLYTGSTQGMSWEAGIVSFDPSLVKKIELSILEQQGEANSAKN